MKSSVQKSKKQAKLRTGRMFMNWRLRPPFFFFFMKSSIDLDQQRADLIEHLYAVSGRTNGLYTGLWDDFCHDLVSMMRDDGNLASFVQNEVSMPETK